MVARKVQKEVVLKVRNLRKKYLKILGTNACRTVPRPTPNWDRLPPAIHCRSRYLSHDYHALGRVIDKLTARFVPGSCMRRDYIQVLCRLGYCVAERGDLTAERGARQRWGLFVNEEKAARQISSNNTTFLHRLMSAGQGSTDVSSKHRPYHASHRTSG
jgi:hypothetical protein